MYNPPIRSNFRPKKKPIKENDLGGDVLRLASMISKVEDILEGVKVTKGRIEETMDEATKMLQHILTIKKGDKGDSPDEDLIVSRVESRIRDLIDKEDIDENKVVQAVLSKIPHQTEFDEKKIIKKIISILPKGKGELKIIKEQVETDPMKIIDQIMNLPEGKFKLKTKHIDGLEQTIRAMQSQLGRGYLHGGGISSIIAGSGITAVDDGLGHITVSAPGSTTDEKVKLNAADPTAGYLDDKITGYGFLTSETDPLSLHLNQTISQTVTGTPILQDGIEIKDTSIDFLFKNVGGVLSLTDSANYEFNAGKILTYSDSATLGSKSTVDGSYAYGGKVGETIKIRVYPYKVVDGVKIFSTNYVEDSFSTIIPISPNYYIHWIWNAVSGADGYRVLSYYNYTGAVPSPVRNFDYYYDLTGTYFDDGDGSMSWTAGSTVTPNTYNDGLWHFDSSNGMSLDFFTQAGFVKTSANGLLSVDTNTYLTAESDTLDSVCGRGATTTYDLTVGNVFTIFDDTNLGACELILGNGDHNDERKVTFLQNGGSWTIYTPNANAYLGFKSGNNDVVIFQDGIIKGATDNTVDLGNDASQYGTSWFKDGYLKGSLYFASVENHITGVFQASLDLYGLGYINNFIGGVNQVIIADGAIYGNTDDDIDLGLSTNWFKDGYMKGSLYFGDVTSYVTAANSSLELYGGSNVFLYVGGTNQATVSDGAIYGTSDNDIDLGTSTYWYKDGYIKGYQYFADTSQKIYGTASDSLNLDGTEINFFAGSSNGMTFSGSALLPTDETTTLGGASNRFKELYLKQGGHEATFTNNAGYSALFTDAGGAGYSTYINDSTAGLRVLTGSIDVSVGQAGAALYATDGTRTCGIADGSYGVNATTINASTAFYINGTIGYTGDLNDSTNTKIADVVGGIITAVYY